MARTSRKDKGVSLAKGPVGLLSLAMIAWGVIHFLMGGNGFSSSPMSGTVNGDTFLGLEGNGWTNVLWVGAGLLLAFGAPMHWGAKSMALIVGLVLGAASVISMVDGNDVFGIFATNGLTQLALGAAATALLILSLLPRVGKKKHRDDDQLHYEDTHRVHRRERVVEREPVEREGRFDRQPVDSRTRVAHGEHRERGVDLDRDGIDDRDELRHRGDDRHLGRGERRVVAPADGDGVDDRARRDRF